MTDPSEVAVVEIRIKDLSQLFNSLDPSPFHERDLDKDAEEFIVGWARELPRGDHISLVIQVAGGPVHLDAVELQSAISNYFAAQASGFERDLRELYRIGRRHLWVGLTVLTACLIASQFAAKLTGPGTLARLIEESLVIVGWVANWKPIEIFLYEWWPHRRRIDLYKRLAEAEVVVISPTGTGRAATAN